MSDLISRQAALDALDKHCDVVCQYSEKQRYVMCGACTLGGAFDVIEQLPSAQPEQEKGMWIAVTERLPEKNGDYIAFSIGGTWNQLSTIELAFWDGASFIPQSFFTVTHWMPLPEPPTIIEAEESET